MSKKKPRSKDPHSWIKDTTKKAATDADEASAVTDEETAVPVSTPQRFVIVEYYKNDGRIFAAHEVHPDAEADAGELPATDSTDRAVARISLSGELFDKTLIDLYENHKVDVSKTKPTIAPKG
jgi:hypothetical protein